MFFKAKEALLRTVLFFMMVFILVPVALQAQDDDFVKMAERVTHSYTQLRDKGAYREALALVEAEIESSTDGVPITWLLDRCRLLMAVGEIDQGISDLDWLYFRRPTPQNALLLAELYQRRGRMEDYRQTLSSASNRYRRSSRFEEDDLETLALLRIRELMGENPKALLQEILNGDMEKPEIAVPRYLAAGELAYGKSDYQLASEYYEQALKLSPGNQDAMAGLAECYWQSHDPRVTETLASLAERNPLHFTGKAVEAELALDGGNAEDALAIAERMLAINSNHFRFLGLKAGALFLLNRQTEMQAVHADALSFNPFASEVFRITGRIASRHYRFKEGADFQRQALDTDDEDHKARAFLAFDLLRMGRDQEGREELERSFKADRYNVQVYNMLTLLDTLAEFAVVARGPFLLKMPPREAEIWSGELLALLDEAFQDMSARYRVDLETPVAVQIFDNHDDFMVRSVGLPGSVGHLGICFGKLITMDSPSARAKWAMNWQSVLYHEFVHVVTLQKTENRMPRWLSEGISVYEETRRNPAWGQRLDPRYKSVLARDGKPTVADLELLFTQPGSAAHLMFGYFASGEFVRFYVDRFGFPTLLKVLERIAAGEKTASVLAEAAEVAPDRLNREFHEALDQRMKALKNLPDPKPSIFENMVGMATSGKRGQPSSPFTDSLEEARLALKEQRTEAAERALKKAHELFPEYMGEERPLTLLADLYQAQGRTEELKTALVGALALDATDFQACSKLTELYRQEKAWAKTRDMAESGLAIDPFDLAMRKARVEALEHLDRHQAALHELERLLVLDPHRGVQYRLQRVDLLMAKGGLGEARAEVVRLLEEVPHSWEGQKRLLAIVAEQGK